ncbi:MAG: hypothetical protein QOJ49_1581 [Actinomycetota bacterium]|jgi:hypothetical protein|nr:hypothetical protein [Actinomycetota bacterium]
MKPSGRPILAVLAAPAAVLLLVLLPVRPAAAACPEPASASAYRFTGSVDRVQQHGQVAFVTISDGRQVEVDGRASGSAGARTFLVGQSYEFHPVNTSAPFRDNACTATHELRDSRFTPETLAVVAVIVAMVLSAPRLARWIRRRGKPAEPGTG